jgi:hypothetical protein
VPHGYCFAQCISNDFALGAGIALEFNERYNMRNRLKEFSGENWDVGDTIKIDNVYNLITKEFGYQKPTYEDLKTAIEDFSNMVYIEKVKKIAIPKIGAGLDKLDWGIVLSILKEAFRDLEDVEILVCFLEGDIDYDKTIENENRNRDRVYFEGKKSNEEKSNEEKNDYSKDDFAWMNL